MSRENLRWILILWAWSNRSAPVWLRLCATWALFIDRWGYPEGACAWDHEGTPLASRSLGEYEIDGQRGYGFEVLCIENGKVYTYQDGTL